MMPALRQDMLLPVDLQRLEPAARATHPPRILLLYGSLRARSYSRLLVEEAARILHILGAEVRIFDPRGLPVADATGADDPKVQELRASALWSEGQVWCSRNAMARSPACSKTRSTGYRWNWAACGRPKAAPWR
jgi:arsenic resistance protein ArsH